VMGPCTAWCKMLLLRAKTRESYTGGPFSLLEEGTHAYFAILLWEISSRLLYRLKLKKQLQNTP